MEGSSRMYSTPMREEPIWVARRMRWLSPPERVPAWPAEGEVGQPHPLEEGEPGLDLLEDLLGDLGLGLGEGEVVHKVRGRGDRLVAEGVNVHPPTVTARASFFSRRPRQVGQGHWLMHSSSSFREASDWVSR